MLPSVRTLRTKTTLLPPAAPAARVQTRASLKATIPNQTAQKPKEAVKENVAAAKVKRLSNEFEKSEESLYSTAMEEM